MTSPRDLTSTQIHLHDYLVGTARDMVQRGMIRHARGQSAMEACLTELEATASMIAKDWVTVAKHAGVSVKTTANDIADKLKTKVKVALMDAGIDAISTFFSSGKRR